MEVGGWSASYVCCTLVLQVLVEAQKGVLNYEGLGVGIMGKFTSCNA